MSPGSAEPGWVLAAYEPRTCRPAGQAGTPASSHLITGGIWKYSGNVVSSVSELCLTVVRKNLFFRLTSESCLFL